MPGGGGSDSAFMNKLPAKAAQVLLLLSCLASAAVAEKAAAVGDAEMVHENGLDEAHVGEGGIGRIHCQGHHGALLWWRRGSGEDAVGVDRIVLAGQRCHQPRCRCRHLRRPHRIHCQHHNDGGGVGGRTWLFRPGRDDAVVVRLCCCSARSRAAAADATLLRGV